MNIALIGYGKMGKAIEGLSEDNGVKVVLTLDANESIEAADFSNVDVAIDFTNPEAALSNLQKLADKKINVVMGTTGWYAEMDKAKTIVEKADIGFLWASNFSIGVHLFWKTLKEASKIFNDYPQYDVYGHEWHHKEKADSPSGTAITTAQVVLDHLDRKTKLVTDKLDRKPNPEELHFSSTRGGYVPGTHAITFDSPVDMIEIKHTARGRQGFALGAIECAKWLKGKKGFFSIEDYLNQ